MLLRLSKKQNLLKKFRWKEKSDSTAEAQKEDISGEKAGQ